MAWINSPFIWSWQLWQKANFGPWSQHTHTHVPSRPWVALTEQPHRCGASAVPKHHLKPLCQESLPIQSMCQQTSSLPAEREWQSTSQTPGQKDIVSTSRKSAAHKMENEKPFWQRQRGIGWLIGLNNHKMPNSSLRIQNRVKKDVNITFWYSFPTPNVASVLLWSFHGFRSHLVLIMQSPTCHMQHLISINANSDQSLWGFKHFHLLAFLLFWLIWLIRCTSLMDLLVEPYASINFDYDYI